jgi:hypothetical protein
MATMQVPGYEPANNDTLHPRCWAESGDKLLTIEALDGNVVRFAAKDRAGRYLEAPKEMPVLEFQKAYSDGEWLWHDKSPVPVAA